MNESEETEPQTLCVECSQDGVPTYAGVTNCEKCGVLVWRF